jgi:fanconi anemia group J protein
VDIFKSKDLGYHGDCIPPKGNFFNKTFINEISSEEDSGFIKFDVEDTVSKTPNSINSNPQPILPQEIININGVAIKYPFKPYSSQIQLMDKLIRALSSKTHALLESPTGTGKTMALLCGTLAWLQNFKEKVDARNEQLRQERREKENLKQNNKEFDKEKSETEEDEIEESPTEEYCEDKKVNEEMVIPKIYYASRTHKQISQVVKELRRTAYCTSFTVLASRTHYCINKKIRNLKKDLTEACIESLRSSENHCNFYNKVDKYHNSHPGIATSMSVEELIRFGNDKVLCPYFLSRESSKHSKIVFCPFDYLVNPGIREAMEISLEDSIVIVDEAHNIEDVCREAGSFEVQDSHLYGVQAELMTFFDKQANHNADLVVPEAHRSQLRVVSVIIDWLASQHSQNQNAKISFEKSVYE